MKVHIDWDEQYPALFLKYESDYDEGYADTTARWEKKQISRYGTEVPEELALKWKAARDAWRAVDKEVQAFTGREP